MSPLFRFGLVNLINCGNFVDARDRLLKRKEPGGEIRFWEQNLLAVCQAKMRGLEEAETLLNQAYLKRPKDAKILNNLGNISLIRGNARKAANFYMKAAKANLWALEPRFNISLAYSELGEFEKALYAHQDYMSVKRVRQLASGFLFLCLLALAIHFVWAFS